MKWLRWLPRILTPVSSPVVGTGTAAGDASPRDGVEVLRSVGVCESCGTAITVQTRQPRFRGRVDCACGYRNHVEYRVVRTPHGNVSQHVSVTRRRKFESTAPNPDLLLGFRYGVCQQCSHAVRLRDALVTSHADSIGILETFTYYCPTCHVHDDARRGLLLGHDGERISDKVRFAVPPGTI